jgi:glycosyltransferase involved in cell wall biosynthesis
VKPKVAICQSSIILGGRLRLILSITEILNSAGIMPDVLTFRLNFRPDQIATKYGSSLNANYRLLPHIPKLPQEFVIVLFNAMLNYYASDYDLLINTSNSLIFLPKSKKVITYMFFPRKRRVMADVVDIHRPDLRLMHWSRVGLQRAALRRIYRFSKPQPEHDIICLSEFTRSALNQEYNLLSGVPVIYPPVDIETFQNDQQERNRAVVTVGRFGPDKRQLEQIKLAEQLPDIPFHIFGFVSNVSYYQQCIRYVEEQRLSNVYLHPDAPFEQMVASLQKSEFFLHTLINEPFGITAVQAAAAGCLPIVHDSGGQRETVLEPELRYQDLNEVPGILKRLGALDTTAVKSLVHRLQEHVASNFSASIFRNKMSGALAPYLGIRVPDVQE